MRGAHSALLQYSTYFLLEGGVGGGARGRGCKGEDQREEKDRGTNQPKFESTDVENTMEA
jgi:hypothetical protein